MNNPDNETIYGPQFHIVSFGDDGHSVAEMLVQTHLMQPDGSKLGRCVFTRLTPLMTAKDIETITRNTDMVFILGSDSQTDEKHTLSLLIDSCLENSIYCYSILNIKSSTSSDNDIITQSKRTNNTLLIPADQSISNVGVYILMKEAVLNFTEPLLAHGLVGVDFEDVTSVLKCGNIAQFSIAEATGNERATQAAHDALSHLPNPKEALSILCNIEAGSDFRMNELEEIGNIICSAVSDNCTYILCSTFNPHADALKVRVTAFY